MSQQKYVYHYTSMKGLEGVVKNRTLRFTDHRFLNDYGEFVRPYETLKKLVDPDIKAMLSDLYMTLNANYSLALFCVSQTCNSLAQMRLYADDCKGAAIVFSTDIWSSASKNNGHIFNTVPLWGTPDIPIFKEPVFTPLESCEYEDIEQYCKKVIKNNQDFLNQLQKFNERKRNLKDLSSSEAGQLFKFLFDIAKWKDKSFNEEQEMRSVALIPKEELFFEGRANDIRPYWEWKTQGNNLDSLILGVILGTKCSNNTADFLAYMLGSSRYSGGYSPQIEWEKEVASSMFDLVKPTYNYFCFKQRATYQ
ncbi:DUF2971 domain-containing protein [Pseudoalteromonas rubra]|nr:DUF2971 domain-containing protein [Pseudoalteromonas rubra]